MLWARFVWLFILFILGRHLCFPASPRYIELADSADYFIERENWDKAEEKIIEALRLEPANFTNSLLLANLGLVQSQKGQYEKALQSLSAGLNMAPSSTILLNNRAHVFLALDNIPSAINDLDRSLQIDSIQEWPLQTRAYLYLDRNEFSEALKIFQKITKEFPNNSSAYVGMGAIAEIEENFKDARSFYEMALSMSPDDEETRETLIFLLIKMEDFSEARKEIKEGLAKNPDNPMLYLLRGYLHRLNYRIEEAQADKKIAISKGLDPSYVAKFIP